MLSYLGDRDSAEATAEKARAHGARIEVVQGDVSDPEQVDALFDLAAEVGQLTGLVNNAGSTLHTGDLADTSPDVVRRVRRGQPDRRAPGRTGAPCGTSSRAGPVRAH